MPDKTKILVIAHGHPDNTKGGGEIAAYNLHNKLNTSEQWHSVFLARHDREELTHPGTHLSGTGRANEILLYSTRNNYFLHSQHNKVLITREFRHTLERVNPDIVHFHHYVHLGLELIREARAFNSKIRIAFTLHEYIAMCNNNGQMMTTNNTLCFESTPQACVKCFPQHTTQDFLMRKLFFKSHFELVDIFISPSKFLKDRYVAWGIPEKKINVIENMLDDEKYDADTHKDIEFTNNKECVRFSFYGQINWFKGLDVLLTAIKKLPKNIRKRIQLDINGSGLDQQPEHLQKHIKHLISGLPDVVNMRGPYTQSELSALMNSSHWMIVPSKWWENSPMVILEARKHGLPVICSNIGGMAEKIEDGKTGIHFQAGRADGLVAAITRVVENHDKQREFANAMKESYKENVSFDQHIQLYQNLLESARESETSSINTIIDEVLHENKVFDIRRAPNAA